MRNLLRMILESAADHSNSPQAQKVRTAPDLELQIPNLHIPTPKFLNLTHPKPQTLSPPCEDETSWVMHVLAEGVKFESESQPGLCICNAETRLAELSFFWSGVQALGFRVKDL